MLFAIFHCLCLVYAVGFCKEIKFFAIYAQCDLLQYNLSDHYAFSAIYCIHYALNSNYVHILTD